MTEAERIWGLRIEKWRELSAFCLASLALMLFLALISNGLQKRWIGSAGDAITNAAYFVFGSYGVAYMLPALLLLAALHAFRGSTPLHPLRKIVSGGFVLVALCALMTLIYAQGESVEAGGYDLSYVAGGVLGSLITSDARYSLNLPRLCGPVGAYLVSLVVLALGIMLSTDFLFVPLIRGVLRVVRRRAARLKRHPEPVATLRFGRDYMPRVFPIGQGESALRTGSEGPAAAEQLVLLSEEYVQKPTAPEPDAGLDLEETALENESDEEEAPELDGLPRIVSSASRRRTTREAEDEAPIGAMIQTELNFSNPDFATPPAHLFSLPPASEQTMDREEVLEISGELERALSDFNISARVVAVTQGPVVTQYELQPAPGVKVSRILSLENDIALILRARSVRIQAPIPGKAAIGIEVPNRKVTPVYFKELIDSETFRLHDSPLAFTLGKNISGDPVICDLASMPHLLIAGTTGSGKSVCVNVIISSILYRMSPDRVKFIMIDPKRVELNVYSDIPHLLAPVVNDPRQAAAALMWAVGQMEERLEAFSKLRVRNIDGYNAVASGKRKVSHNVDIEDLSPIPHIVIIIDELADLMIIAKNEVEEFIVRLAQMSRAAGIHMIIATQRPSVNVLTGIIKANFPSRIAFRVSAKVDSRTILDMNGAETLLGQGDMLFAPGGTKPMRIQGAFLSDQDVERLTDFLRSQNPAHYEKTDFAPEEFSGGQDDGEEDDGAFAEGEPGESVPAVAMPRASHSIAPESSFPSRRESAHVEFPSIELKGDVDEDEVLYEKALRLVLETGKPSVSMIQRRIKIGFARAGRLMDLMEERGIVGPYLGSKPRTLLVDDPEALLRRLDEMERERMM